MWKVTLLLTDNSPFVLQMLICPRSTKENCMWATRSSFTCLVPTSCTREVNKKKNSTTPFCLVFLVFSRLICLRELAFNCLLLHELKENLHVSYSLFSSSSFSFRSLPHSLGSQLSPSLSVRLTLSINTSLSLPALIKGKWSSSPISLSDPSCLPREGTHAFTVGGISATQRQYGGDH